jgi:hypothetical protein
MTGCVLLLCCASAAAQDVRYNYLQGTDFSKYATYKWVQAPNVQYPNQILDDQIKQAIDAQLGLKGLRRVEGDGPDLYVVYQAAVNQEKQWNAYSSGGGGYWGYGGWGGWGGYGGMGRLGRLRRHGRHADDDRHERDHTRRHAEPRLLRRGDEEAGVARRGE